MLKVLGASPEKIELPELGDRIYYKQEKTFSELEYKKSHTLRHAIDVGSVIVLERVCENKEYGIPPVSEINIPVAIPDSAYPPPTLGGGKNTSAVKSLDSSISENKLDLLLKKISDLEGRIDNDSGKIIVDSTPLNIILDRLKELEKKISTGTASTSDEDHIIKTLKSLEDKINKGSVNDDLVKRLEETISRAGTVNSKSGEIESGPSMEMYVPNVTVEDANSHINLKVRTIEKSDDLNSSLDALRKLKVKSK